jgi:hypothetical protein
MSREIIIEGCGRCPFLKTITDELMFGCRLDTVEDPELSIKIDPDFLDDVPEKCPLFGGVYLRLSSDADATDIDEFAEDDDIIPGEEEDK